MNTPYKMRLQLVQTNRNKTKKTHNTLKTADDKKAY